MDGGNLGTSAQKGGDPPHRTKQPAVHCDEAHIMLHLVEIVTDIVGKIPLNVLQHSSYVRIMLFFTHYKWSQQHMSTYNLIEKKGDKCML